jgi:hypothetical protein
VLPLEHIQPPPNTERSHLVPTAHTHPTDDYGAIPLLRRVGGGVLQPRGDPSPTQCRGGGPRLWLRLAVFRDMDYVRIVSHMRTRLPAP